MNTAIERRQLWHDLHLCSSNEIWCILGDFNAIRSLSEAEGGENTWDHGMEEFRDCLDSLGVEDIRALGPHFTWWNCQELNPIYRKLDRVFGNSAWFTNTTDSQALFSPRGLSDHSPIILYSGIQLHKVPRPFQFFNFMLDLDGFSATVQDAWNSHVTGNPMYILAEKLRRTKKALISLNSIGNLSSNVKNLQAELLSIQSALNESPTNSSSRAREKHCIHNLWKALSMEESCDRNLELYGYLLGTKTLNSLLTP